MGRNIAPETTRQTEAQDELIRRFAAIMWKRYGGRMYLFGSRAAGTAEPDSDYDLVVVSRAFGEQRATARVTDRYDLWHEAGGWGLELDLHCYTPEEYREELAGLGYLGQAKRRGELVRVQVQKAA